MNLIIGGSSGLGKSLTIYFSEIDKTLTVSRKLIKLKSKNIISIKLDINNHNLSRLYKSIKKEELSNIFFSVGLAMWNEDNLNLNYEKSKKILDTNFHSITKITNELIKRKKLKKNCLICFCSSASTILPRHRQIIYCASKSALNSYYKSLKTSLYLRNLNYRVVNLILGYMDTKMSKGVATPFKKINPDKIARYIFINRKKLHGIYHLPKYWYLIRLIVDLLPDNIVQKIIKNF